MDKSNNFIVQVLRGASQVYFMENARFFKRKGTHVGREGETYDDNAERALFFGGASSCRRAACSLSSVFAKKVAPILVDGAPRTEFKIVANETNLTGSPASGQSKSMPQSKAQFGYKRHPDQDRPAAAPAEHAVVVVGAGPVGPGLLAGDRTGVAADALVEVHHHADLGHHAGGLAGHQ